MYHENPVASTRLRARKLQHRKISHLNELREIYTIGDVIGKGNFGTVVKAKHKETKTLWAIKIINKRQAGASRVLSVEREIYILKLVNHPHIIYLDCVYESPRTIYLVFELCIASLAKVLKKMKQFEEAKAINIIQSLSSALAYLHKNDIVHRDLKLENILTAYNPRNSEDDLFIKVTDFGLSTMRSGPGHENMLNDFCGTLAYMAPEMVTTKSYSQQCDVWSMGIIMYLLLFGKFPFLTNNDQELCKLISKADIDFSELPCSPEARHLLSKLLEKNPAFRLTAAEVENHAWISGIGTALSVTPSNVLDMMHQWREEMLESTSEDAIKKSVSVKKQETFEKPKTVIEEKPETSNKKSSIPAISRISQKNMNFESRASVKQNFKYERASSRVPDFSHIRPKVDSNLRKNIPKRNESKRPVA